MVAQLFKPNYYLNESSIQSTYHSSRILFNSDYPEFVRFKEGLMAQGDMATQGIAEMPTQSQSSVGSELAGGSVSIETIESVLNMTQETECWVLGEMVSIQAGAKDRCYASCTNYFKKVETKSDRYKCEECGKLGSKPPLKYRLIVIITDGTGYINVLLWNSEAGMIVGKSAREVMNSISGQAALSYPKIFEEMLEKKYLMKLSVSRMNINNVDQVYSVVKATDDENLIEQYSSQSSFVSQEADQSVSYDLVTFGFVDGETDLGAFAVVSLSKKSASKSNCGNGLQTPIKSGSADSQEVIELGGTPSLDVHVQASNNKTFRRGGTKKKSE